MASSSSSAPCVLGFAVDQSVCSPPSSSSTSNQVANWYDTRIGGFPIWPEPPAPTIPCCPRCSAPRFLILQAFAPHQKHPNRLILVFACNNIRCSAHSNTWLALRIFQVKHDQEEKHSPNFGVDVNEDIENNTQFQEINWDDEDDGEHEEDEDDDLLEGLESLSLKIDDIKQTKAKSSQSETNKKVRHKSKSNEPATAEGYASQSTEKSTLSFPSYYVEVDNEPSKARTDNKRQSNNKKESVEDHDEQVQKLLDKYLEEEKKYGSKPNENPQQNWAAEQEDEENENEKALQNFLQVIARSPYQILRYCTDPLWPCIPPNLKHTTCDLCGSNLIFELQILSSCLNYLKVDRYIRKGQRDAGLNFSTVALFTCANDCDQTQGQNNDSPLYISDSFIAFNMAVQVVQDDW